MAEGNGRWPGGLSVGNAVALVAILGGVIAVYTEMRSTEAVVNDKLAALAREMTANRAGQEVFAEQMRGQLNQLSKDVAYLQALMSMQGQTGGSRQRGK